MSSGLPKNIRLPRDRYIGRHIYFLTICCHARRPAFANPERCQLSVEALRTVSSSQAFLVHAYCIMPDHVHFLLEGKTQTSDLHLFVTRFKQKTGYLFREEMGRDLWQERYYDHALRKPEDSEHVAWYIWTNPVRKGLAADPSQYPFSGSFTVEWPKTPKRDPTWCPPWKNPASP